VKVIFGCHCFDKK
jgi:hypothetical protein